MLATWAPADLFNSSVSMITLPLKRGITYFDEHTPMLALVLVLIAIVIATVEASDG